MSRLKTGVLVAVAILAAAVSGGVVGGGAAVALVRNAYNGPTAPAVRPEVLVNSDELGEPIPLGVHLPIEYDPDGDRRFPVLWVLDGPSHGARVARTMQVLSRIGVAEPSIVVEVPSSGRGRTADFTPPRGSSSSEARADRFLQFLTSEAIPAVAEAYRVDDERVLVGHSLGGLFALYSFLREPSLFDGYFVFSPSAWVGDDAILGDLERAVETQSPLSAALYMSLGAGEGNRMLSGFEAVNATLEAWSAPGLRLQAAITDGADHRTNPELSFPVAAKWYWAG